MSALAPREAAAWHQRGRELQLQGDAAGAEQAYRQALVHDPLYRRSLNNLAVLVMQRFQPEEADGLLQRGLAGGNGAEHPAEMALLLNTLCQLRLQQQRPLEAVAVARQLVELAPDDPHITNLAVALQSSGQPEAALRAQRLALGLVGRDSLQWLWQPFGDAQASAQRQRQLQNLATMALALDPFSQRGWALLQARLAAQPQHWSSSPAPWQGLWSGDVVPELLLWDEQGYGDAIQCLRWLPLAAQRTQRLRFWVRPELQRLVHQRLELPAHVQLEPLRPGAASWHQGVPHLPLMSLPLVLGLVGESAMAGSVPFRRGLGSGGHRIAGEPLRLGLVWAAGRKPEAEADRHARSRSLPLAQLMAVLAPLVQQGRVRLQCLQVGVDAREAEAFRAVLEPAPPLGDWAATAGVMEQLDGLISVDTAAAHLGGSLGLPTLLLLDTPCDWRWGQQGPATCWYPSVRLVRYRQAGGLGNALERALAAWL